MTEFRPIFESQNQPLVVKLERRDRSVTVDDELSDTSTNPVQNKVITKKLSEQADIIVSSASGTIASFPDGAESTAKKLVVGIEPVQDLHGYDHPWPAGGGMNLLPFDEVFEEGWTNTLNGITATYSKGYMRVTGTNTSTGWTNIVSKDSVWASNVKTFGPGSYAMGGDNKLVIACMIDGGSRENKATPFTAETSVAVRGFYIAVGGGQTVDWNIPLMFIRGTDRPTSYSPYSNTCPITGWTVAKVTRTGRNLIRTKVNGRTAAGITFTVQDDGSIVANGTATGSAWLTARLTDHSLMTLIKAGTYTVSGGKNANAVCYLGGEFVDGSAVPGYYDRGSGVTFTLPKDAWVYPQVQIYEGLTCENMRFDFMLEYGSTATAYEPYAGSVLDIQFPSEAGTVYSGTLTVNEDGTGKLVVDKGEVDLGTLSWSYSSEVFGANIQGMKSTTTLDDRKTGIISDCYPTSTTLPIDRRMDDKSMLRAYGGIYIRDTDYTSTTDFASAVNGHQLVYELDTPIEYPLTDLEVIDLLKGTNNVWADTGDTSVTYRADTKLYIDNKITQAIANALNSRT